MGESIRSIGLSSGFLGLIEAALRRAEIGGYDREHLMAWSRSAATSMPTLAGAHVRANASHSCRIGSRFSRMKSASLIAAIAFEDRVLRILFAGLLPRARWV